MKRIFSLLLALTLLLSMFPIPARAAETATDSKTLTVTADPGVAAGEDLHAVYATQVLFGLPHTPRGTSAGTKLSGDLKTLYDALVPVLREIAEGKRKNTVIGVGKTISFGGKTLKPDVEATFAGSDLTSADLRKLLTALLSDLPYELYWYDKTSGCSTEIYSGKTILYMNLKFSVAANYRTSDYNVDVTKTSAAANAVKNAQHIIDCYADSTDYNKLIGYADAICDLADYNHTASDKGVHAQDNDPWQLIYVFDGDPATKVVCEAYAKAYLYLCDLSSFQGDVVCNTVTGTMNGGAHMWNIITLGEKNYLVDVTNTDTGTYGSKLLLAGCTGDVNKGYQVAKVKYQYDSATKDFWSSRSGSILTISSKSYSPSWAKNHTHSYGSWKTAVSASPSSIGVKYRSCSVCGFMDASCSSAKQMTAPSLSLSNDPATGKPKLSWKAVSGADAYRVYRATSKSGSYTRLTSTSATGYTDTGAKTGKKYYYKIVAVNNASGKTSKYSSILSCVCDLAQPAVSITGSSKTGKPIVKWETVEGATKYYIYRSTGSSFSHIKTAVSARSYEDTTAKAGTKYYYRVKAIYKDTAANSAYSDTLSRVCDLPRPTVTLKLNSSGAPYLSWKAVSGAKNYRIYRSETKDGEYTYLGSTTKLKYADKTAEDGIEYFYKVKAMHSKSAAASAYSPVKSITP